MGIKDFYNTGDDNAQPVWDTEWVSQTFIATASYSCVAIRLKLVRTGSLANVTVSIKGVDGSRKPTGADLAAATIDGNTITDSGSGDWYEFSFPSAADITSTTEYAIVLRMPGQPAGFCSWAGDFSSSPFGGIMWASPDSGGTWPTNLGGDAMFETYAAAPGAVGGIASGEFHTSGGATARLILAAAAPGGLTLAGYAAAMLPVYLGAGGQFAVSGEVEANQIAWRPIALEHEDNVFRGVRATGLVNFSEAGSVRLPFDNTLGSFVVES